MKNIFLSFLVFTFLILSGCGSEDILTRKEIETQNKADAVVSGILFEHDMNDLASYNVKKDGSVVIKFADTVSLFDYTEVVNKLRRNKSIKSVYAEQSGREVCGVVIRSFN